MLPKLLIWDHPRLRGEYFQGFLDGGFVRGSPPLARGVPIFSSYALVKHGITPACAGSTKSLSTCIAVVKDHPRLRGEYFG